MSVIRKEFEAWWNNERMATAFHSFKHVAEEAFEAGHAASGRNELLEACEELLSHSRVEPLTDMGMWEHKLQLRKIQDKARAAIKKARGE